MLAPLYAAIATSAFSILFGLGWIDASIASCGAALGWAVYQWFPALHAEAFSVFFAALAAGLFSEIASYFRRKPATVYMIASIIPLVPGGGMYYTMLSTLEGNTAKSVDTGIATLMTAFSIAIGLAVANVIGRIAFGNRYRPLRSQK